ncbi:MAG: CRISPR-associated protein [Stigonema ocellatum SAG 48.90 = DSM 106950]|nr:CRISPR-associated protein [Stigonema ocellatum SAG 48.90 = DSM 106950]
MTKSPPSKPQRRTPPTPPPSREFSEGTSIAKPYELISFPQERPTKLRPAGHDKYDTNRLHGILFLTLKVQTSLHVSTGVVVMGSDIGSRVSLIKTMVQGIDQKLSIQGSSLKGCIRSVYEAITRSCLCKTKADINQIPDGYRECKINIKKQQVSLCHACQIFGAMDWQGLIDFNDAQCENVGFSTGFMPSLYRPRPDQRRAYFDENGKVAGRKFYYHTVRAIDKGQNQGIAVQQAAREYTFTTQLHFRNLKPEELGTLLIVLGQDPKYPIALKMGGGKPIGMGTMTVEVRALELLQNAKDWRDRYSAYTPAESNRLTVAALQQFVQKQIQAAHSQLIQATQLQQLAEVLRYPTHREPPEGMY